MTELKTFNHPLFGELLVMIVDEVEWFGAIEAAKALSFSNPYKAIDNHVESEDCTVHTVLTNGGKQQKKFTNESGLYDLIFGAAKQGNNPEIKVKAKQFKKWVTSEVLPTIRKTGGYVQENRAIDFVNTWLPHLDENSKYAVASTLEENRKLLTENNSLKTTIEEQKPKVFFAEALESSKESILVNELAKIIKKNGVDIGEKRLFAWLREKGFLIKQKGESYNLPTQKSMDLGLMEIKKGFRGSASEGIKPTRTPKITPKGQIYFINKFLKETA